MLGRPTLSDTGVRIGDILLSTECFCKSDVQKQCTAIVRQVSLSLSQCSGLAKLIN